MEFIFNRTDEEIEQLNKTIRPLFKKGFWGRLYQTSYVSTDEDVRNAEITGPAFGLKKLRVVDINVPACGYKGNFLITPRTVLSQIPNSELKNVTNYYVEVQYPRDNILEYYMRDSFDAKVVLFGDRRAAKTSSNVATTK